MGVFEDLGDFFKKKTEDAKTLSEDIKRMSRGQRRTTSIEPVTVLRPSRQELVNAIQNPDEQFIKDKLEKLLGD